MSTKDDMIDKMGITHNGTKVHRMLQLHKTCQAMGSPSATSICIAIPVVMPAFSLRSNASITTGYSDGRPSGVFIVDPCLHAGYPDVCPPGANGDKPPCMRESPRGCPFSTPWYLPLRSVASITTGYSDGRPTGVFIVDSCLHAGYPNVCPPGANGDKTPCMRETPRGWPFSNPWYLPAKRAQRVQGQAPRVQQAIGSVAEGDPIAPVAM